jgi:flagellum-specific peptidoglycan hydrolase FlgJ
MKPKAPVEIVILMCLFAATALISVLFLKPTGKAQEQATPDSIDFHVVELSVWEYINKIGIQHPDIVYAQFQLETGHGTSELYLEHNNLFGMQVPNKRPYLGKRGTLYAHYEHWHHSCHDYLIWQILYAWNLTHDEYLMKLSRMYATDPHYIKKINHLIK